MVSSCCAFGCTNRFVKNSGIGFFRFPLKTARRKIWTVAIRRKNFEPTRTSVICGEHFQTGRPSRDSNHPDYVPNIFLFKHLKKRGLHNAKRKKLESRSEKTINDNSTAEMDVDLQAFTTSKTKEASERHKELLNLKLELDQAYTDLNTLRIEKDALVKEFSAANRTQSILHTAISIKEEEFLRLKMERQQAYTEISALRTEKEELQKKLVAADLTQGILKDASKLQFYTGLHSVKDFHLILSLVSNVENNVNSISLETQVLIVLMKLKLNLLYGDLGYIFQTSSSTIYRICGIIIPPLETKLDLLVKSPVNNALKKNIPVCFKNTVYENLYQRLHRNSKPKTKKSQNEDSHIM